MKKMWAFFALGLFPVLVGANQDSVAVFFKPEKTVVLINENSVHRIHALMDHFGVNGELHLLSSDESVKIDCGRTATTGSCTFRFLPSALVEVGDRVVHAQLPIQNRNGSLDIYFMSSRGDHFTLVTTSSGLEMTAGKSAR